MSQSSSEPRKDFADFAEPFCAGYIAHRDGLSEDPEEFSAALIEAWRNSGSERARRVIQAVQEPGERDAESWG